MNMNMQAMFSNPILCTIREFGLGATRVSQEILIFLGDLDFLVRESRLVKPDIPGLVGMFEDGLLVVLLKSLPRRDVGELADLTELVTTLSLYAKLVARGLSFEPREKPLFVARFRVE